MNAETRIDFLYLSEPDMIKAGVTDMAACVDCMEEMFGLLHVGDYRMAGPNNDSHGAMVVFPAESPFPTMPKPTADRRFMAMPAYLGGRFCTTGMKWYGSNIANRDKGLPRSILMFTLNDTETGAPLAHMSANLLSAYRTGAVPGVGARHLARPDSKVVGILGPGVMAKTTLSAFMVACPGIDTLKVKGRGEKSLQTFLAWVGETYPQITSVTVVDSIEEVVRGSDLFSYCNSGETGDPSTYPIVKREWVKPGAFMAMPAVCNIDDGMQAPDVRKVLDNTGLYEAWYEEVPKPAHNTIPVIGVKFMDMIAEGKLTHDDLEDLGAIVAGDAPGRKNDQEIIIMSVGGMPVEDVAWGTVLYRNALERGIGVKLNLWDEPVLR
ncbi:ornithine cyclodeaminase [Rhodobacter capsulatus]|uniref:tyramine oxidase subunit B n=1 Tax=Rhodobacter capsulatus TaxID=1061 RepID=UPI0006DC5553|nr:tyramine oxidase subunit B [Rhodobacter capsulatus]KQB14264.1 ornithine cyclodeaminase [Rhodobacter capsulatus]KQB17847.1 ornithine cyclodeaminase [Rhodobacter capsulatus]PZX27130.1 ornithine cyclodeaminase [Rhodobacter capsulatus]QNR64229.1 ornithine cyclodeaminase [Rhodobacter capsulatus]